MLAIFEVEPIGEDGALEANGRVYHFCSGQCRSTFDLSVPAHLGESDDWIDGAVCDKCGEPLHV